MSLKFSSCSDCESVSDEGDFGPPPNKRIQCVKDVADYIGKTLSDSESTSYSLTILSL